MADNGDCGTGWSFEFTNPFNAIGPDADNPLYRRISFYCKVGLSGQPIEVKLEDNGAIKHPITRQIFTTEWIIQEIDLMDFTSSSDPTKNVDLTQIKNITFGFNNKMERAQANIDCIKFY